VQTAVLALTEIKETWDTSGRRVSLDAASIHLHHHLRADPELGTG